MIGRVGHEASRREGGAASLLATACLGVLILLGAALAVAGAMIADHRRAQSAADLAALAGAVALERGHDGCAQASALAAANDTTVIGCRVEGHDLLVTVRAAGPRWLGQVAGLDARARAGPG